MPLLFPIENKDYSASSHTKKAWDAATALFGVAFTMTIFGYSAPDSDADAVELLKRAWFQKNAREIEHIEIVDIADADTLAAKWSPFAPTHHYHVERKFEESRLWRWPRRSCESLFYPMTEGIPCEDFPLPSTATLDVLQRYVAKIAVYERAK